MIEINIVPATSSRHKEVDLNKLEFGKYISDHMLVADYSEGNWHNVQIIPYGDMVMNPAMLALHYGQSVFEGMKAYRMEDGNISVFRVNRHHERLNKSLARMCMPAIPENLFVEGLEKLISIDQQWVPSGEGASLYIRPLVFATENRLGVKISDKYKFIIMTSPVGPYYAKPLKLKVETTFVRAAEGGTGFAKCAGNYGGSYYPAQKAKEEGFDQVLWTDAKEHRYIDESGTMNILFVIDGKLITPPLSSAILDGVTRDSILTLARDMDIKIDLHRISIDELRQAFEMGWISEAFGAGTAAVVAPVASISIEGVNYTLPEPKPDCFMFEVKQRLNDIRLGKAPDAFNWNHIIKC
jgi:branched-chain amino acid aminotransferase